MKMRMIRTRILVGGVAAAMLVLSLPACRKHRVGVSAMPGPASPAKPAAAAITPGEFVTGGGHWEYDSEEGVLTLSARPMGGGVSWGAEFSGVSTGGTVTLSSRSDPWFIYLEGPRSLWIFHGQEELNHVVLNEDGSSTHETARGTHEFRFDPATKAPQAVLDRLPEPMRKILPPAPPMPPPPPKQVRPSI